MSNRTSNEKLLNRALRFVVQALRALHADRYLSFVRAFPADWKVVYAFGARETAWLRYACKVHADYLDRLARLERVERDFEDLCNSF